MKTEEEIKAKIKFMDDYGCDFTPYVQGFHDALKWVLT